jgi:hypothetical protein
MDALKWTDKDGESFEISTQDAKPGKTPPMALVRITPAKNRARSAPQGAFITRAQARELVGWLRLVLDEEC